MNGYGDSLMEYVFKLFFPNGKTFLTQEFGNKNFGDCFNAFGKKIFYAVDKVVLVGEYSSDERALEVCDAIINSYNSRRSFTLPRE